MRVLMLAAVPFFSERGMGFAIADRVRAVVELGHQVDLLTLPSPGKAGGPPIPRLRIIRLPALHGLGDVPIGPSPAKAIYNILLAAWAAGKLARHRYDCVHAHGESAWFAWPIARLFGVPLLYDVHFDPAEEFAAFSRRSRLQSAVASSLHRQALRRAATVIAISPDLAKRAAAERPRRATMLIENRPLERMFELADYSPPHQPRVIYTGNLSPAQGIELLLAAAAEAVRRRPDVRFEIIGGSSARVTACRAAAQRLGVAGAVEFTGPLAVGAMAQRMESASVLVSPRVAGQTPLKLYSYLAAGRPIVATDVPAHCSVLTGELARLVEPQPAALAAGIVDLLDHPDQAVKLARAARSFARARFDWSEYRAQVATALGDAKSHHGGHGERGGLKGY